MHRSGFEWVCDVIANMQTSLHEHVQWVLTLLCLGAAALLVGTMMGT